MFIYHDMLDCLRLREISFWHYCQRVWASPCLVLVNVSVCGKIKIVSYTNIRLLALCKCDII